MDTATNLSSFELEIELTLRHHGDVVAVAEELAYREAAQHELARLERKLGRVTHRATDGFGVMRQEPYRASAGQPLWAAYATEYSDRDQWSGSYGFEGLQSLVACGLYRRA